MQWFRIGKKKTINKLAVVIISLLSVISFAANNINDDRNPVQYLYVADKLKESDQCKAAISIYDKIFVLRATPSIKAMAYWNAHLCHEELNNSDGSAKSLLGFIVYGLQIVDYIESLSPKKASTGPAHYWLNEFKINSKLTEASSKLTDIWEQNKNEGKIQ